MPSLTAEFGTRVADALRIAEIGEVARFEASRNSQTRKNLHPARLEYLYEMAYLKVFVSWEIFLEQTFIRYLCGYVSSVGAAIPKAGIAFATNLAKAESAVLQGRSYVLWHNPTTVVKRAQSFFTSNPLEPIILSNTARLERLAAIRHRITHAQSDAQDKFDLATMGIAGKRYRGSRAGAFLRDVDGSMTPPIRWIEQLGQELRNLAAQIA